MKSDNTDYAGQSFNHWRVIKYDGKKNGLKHWICLCVCGTKKSVAMGNLKSGKTKSCGCGAHRLRSTIHNLTSRIAPTPTYRSWVSMKQRCLNPLSPAYPYYGGRGIFVCSGLFNSVTGIVSAIGKRPNVSMTIDRINNDESYTCGSCGECISQGWKLNIRWATRLEQRLNQRPRRRAA